MADKAEFLQAVNDAILDADSLEKFINGSEDETVFTRLSAKYPTIRKALKELFENNGIAGRYKTLVELQTKGVSLADGSYALVADDIDDKNGIYIKEVGAWVKSKYDPSSLALGYVTENAEALKAELSDSEDSIAKLIEEKTKNTALDGGKDVLIVSDIDGNIVAKIDANSDAYLAGVEGSVQYNLSKLKQTEVMALNKGMTHVFTDSDENIVFALDRKSGLILKGLNVSLQEFLDIRPRKESHQDFHPNLLFTDEATRYIAGLSGTRHVPAPYALLPQNYKVDDSIVNSFTFEPESAAIPIDTPYLRNDKVVHPHVIEFRNGFRGYRYLMVINPYTYVNHENPVIYGSDDLNKWEMLTGFAQPLDTPDSGQFHSDSGFTYDPVNGELICFWRDGKQGDDSSLADQIIWYKATKDGIHWSEDKLMAGVHYSETLGENRHYTSLSILFNPTDNKWHLFSAEKSTIWHYTADRLDDSWVFKSSTPAHDLWHMEVKFVGDKFVVLINKRGYEANYYLGISSDGDNWTFGKWLYASNIDAGYKASFLPKFNKQGQLKLEIVYTTNLTKDPNRSRALFRTRTNFIDI